MLETEDCTQFSDWFNWELTELLFPKSHYDSMKRCAVYHFLRTGQAYSIKSQS